jgi:hypothetical protein
MPLRKSPTITSRLLDANRANAQHSTGPAMILTPEPLEHPFYGFQIRCWGGNRGDGGQGERRISPTSVGGTQASSKNRTTEARMSFRIKGPQKRTHQVTENKQLNSTLKVNISRLMD